MWSIPPVWMSNGWPKNFLDMAEHSRCQPGNPFPHGDSKPRSLLNFQREKSEAFLFSGFLATLAPSLIPRIFMPPNFPYPSYFEVSKYIPSDVLYANPFS